MLDGEIPDNISNLLNLNLLSLFNNQLSGNIPNSICNIPNIDYNYIIIENNKFCPPYPDCIEYTGYQDISSCNEECSDNIEGDLNYDGIINIIDIVTLVNCILSYNRCDICFDINYDQEINVIDIISLVNLVLNN